MTFKLVFIVKHSIETFLQVLFFCFEVQKAVSISINNNSKCWLAQFSSSNYA